MPSVRGHKLRPAAATNAYAATAGEENTGRLRAGAENGVEYATPAL
jgi:hypothetical protein